MLAGNKCDLCDPWGWSIFACGFPNSFGWVGGSAQSARKNYNIHDQKISANLPFDFREIRENFRHAKICCSTVSVAKITLKQPLLIQLI